MKIMNRLTTCQECFKEGVRVDVDGYLYRHKNPHTKRRCNGSGRHMGFNKPRVRGANRNGPQ
jgi:hypothetical protein